MQWQESRTNFERNLAVVIGIDSYGSKGIHNLQTAVSDANAIANLLRDEYGYKEEHIVRLFSPKHEEAKLKTLKQSYCPATLQEIRKLLTETLPNQLKPTPADRLLFYFAGHGIPRNSKDGPAGYLVPQNADLNNAGSFLPMQYVYEQLSQLTCHHLLVILDCCFAGTFQWAGSRKLIPILETVRREHYDRFIRFPAWQVITSSAHDQEAMDVALDNVILAEDKRGTVTNSSHSPFALALIEGLKDNRADLIPDGVVTAHELYLYLEQRVSELSKERQNPGLYPLRREYDRGEFIFTKPGFTRDQLKPAPPLDENNNPYRGLKSFDEKHALFFFGRQALIEELAKRLLVPNQLLTVVLGVSGSGKSSLVKAGLIPYLRDKQAKQWYILEPMRPGKLPFTSLARVFLPVVNANLLEQLSQVSFLDEALKRVLESKTQADQDLGRADQAKPESDRSLQMNEALIKVAQSWGSATPEAKLLLIEDYFAQLETVCHPEERQLLVSLHEEILTSLNWLLGHLQQNPQYLIAAIKASRQNHPDTKLLLVIDQFEELITASHEAQADNRESDEAGGVRTTEPKQWQPFLETLQEAIAACPEEWRVVLTLRSDFEPRFLDSPLKSYWKDARFPIRAMNSDELRQAIEGPALKQALYFEPPELVGKLIDEVGQMPGALPLLSFTLSELYIKLRYRWVKDNASDRALRIKDYEELGGIAGALTRRATEEYDNLIKYFGKESGKAYQTTMRRVMLRMVTIEGGGVARRRVPESELVYPDSEENKRVGLVSNRLVKARLLVKGQETGKPYVEPAHDFLVRGWDKLQSWIKEEQEDLALQQRLTIAAQDWIRRRGSLWIEEADRLIKLNEVINSNNNWLNRLETVFVKRSSKVRQDRIKKLEEDLRISEQRRRIADSRQLAAQSQAVFKDYPQRALLLAVEALQVTLEEGDPPVVAAEQTLRDALSNIGGKPLLGHTRGVIVLKVSPNNRWLVSVSDKERIHLWDLEFKDFAQSPIILKHDDVRTAVFSFDGHWLATGGEDGIVRLWDLAAENIAAEPKIFTHIAYVWSIAISPDSRWLAAGTLHGGDARLWDLSADDSNSNPIILHQTRQVVSRIDFSQDNNWVAIGTKTTVMPEDNPYRSEGNAYLWNLQAQNIPSSMKILSGHQGAGVNEVAFSPDNRWLATAGDDGIARLWDLYTEDVNANSIPLHSGHKAAIHSIAFSPDNHWLATESDSTACLWDMKSKTPASKFMILQGHERSGAVPLAFSSNSHWLATFGDKKAWLWDLTADNPADKPTILRGHDSSILSATFSPDSHWFITGGSGGQDNFIRLWDLNSNNWTEMPNVLLGNKNDITSSAISQNKKWLLTESADHTVRLWDLMAKNVASSSIVLDTDNSFTRVLAISCNKQWAVIIDKEKMTHLWNLETDTFKSIHQHRKRVYPVVFSHNNRWLATCIDPNIPEQSRTVENSMCQLWDLTAPSGTLTPISLKGHEKDITSVTYSVDNRWLVTASEDQTARLWDLAASDPSDRPLIFQGHEDGISSVTISPNGHWLMTGGRDKIIRLWDLTAKNPASSAQVLQGHEDKVRVAAFSPNNQWLVTGSYDSTVRLWNLANNKSPVKSINLRGFEHFIITLDISQDGHWLVAGSVDGNIGLWNLASRDIAITEAIILRTGKVFVGNVAITPDNQWIVSVGHDHSDDHTIQLWTLDLETMIERARRLAGRHLTVAEWEQYLPSRSYPYQLS